MKAAIHVANLGALKRLHQMFSQKLWAVLLSGTEWKKSLWSLTTQPPHTAAKLLSSPPQISMVVKTKPSMKTYRTEHTVLHPSVLRQSRALTGSSSYYNRLDVKDYFWVLKIKSSSNIESTKVDLNLMLAILWYSLAPCRNCISVTVTIETSLAQMWQNLLAVKTVHLALDANSDFVLTLEIHWIFMQHNTKSGQRAERNIFTCYTICIFNVSRVVTELQENV